MMTLSKIRNLFGKPEEFDCRQAQGTMSAFIDSMTGEEETQRLEAHVAGCAPCRRQLQGYVSLRNFISGMAPPAIPEDLQLEARISLSHARSSDLRLRFSTRVDNSLKPHALPALAGVLATVLCFSFLLGNFGASLTAAEDSVAVLWLETHPRARDPLILQLAELGLDDLTVDVAIDQEGRVFSTVILNGPEDPAVNQWLRDVIMLGEFYPATIYGQPVPSRLVMSFVGVRGSPLA